MSGFGWFCFVGSPLPPLQTLIKTLGKGFRFYMVSLSLHITYYRRFRSESLFFKFILCFNIEDKEKIKLLVA